MASHYRPWLPVKVRPNNDQPLNNLEIRKCDAIAIHAVANGIASEGQQKMAMGAILHMCGINDLAWMPEEHGGERDSAFAAGKQFVGHQLRKIITLSISVLTGEANERPEHNRRTGKPADERNSRRAKQ